MADRVTIVWRSRSPTVVDERLVLRDGHAHLVVLAPRLSRGQVGSYVADPTDEERDALLAVGPGPIELDAWHPGKAPAAHQVREIADRVAQQALASPRAVVAFEARVADVAPDGGIGLALVATGIGSQPVRFTLEAAASSLILAGTDGRRSSAAMPSPETGFVTAEASTIGERGREARLDPDVTAALTFRIPAAPAVSAIAIEVAGTLREPLVDDAESMPFGVRTPEAPIPR